MKSLQTAQINGYRNVQHTASCIETSSKGYTHRVLINRSYAFKFFQKHL